MASFGVLVGTLEPELLFLYAVKHDPKENLIPEGLCVVGFFLECEPHAVNEA